MQNMQILILNLYTQRCADSSIRLVNLTKKSCLDVDKSLFIYFILENQLKNKMPKTCANYPSISGLTKASSMQNFKFKEGPCLLFLEMAIFFSGRFPFHFMSNICVINLCSLFMTRLEDSFNLCSSVSKTEASFHRQGNSNKKKSS